MTDESRALRVALVNDYEIVVQGLGRMLEPFADIDIVELDAELTPQQSVDLALYDAFGREDPDCDAIRTLVASPNIAHVAVYTWNVFDGNIARARNAGVTGFLSKSMTAGHLAAALRRIAAGEHVFSVPEPVLPEQTEGDWPGRDAGLTAREAEMISMITQGYSNQEIAERAYLSINSVKGYIRTAYRRLGVSRRSQAVRWGIEHGMLPRQARENNVEQSLPRH